MTRGALVAARSPSCGSAGTPGGVAPLVAVAPDAVGSPTAGTAERAGVPEAVADGGGASAVATSELLRVMLRDTMAAARTIATIAAYCHSGVVGPSLGSGTGAGTGATAGGGAISARYAAKTSDGFSPTERAT